MSRGIFCVFTIVVVSVTSLPEYTDNCGCLLICRDKFNPENAVIEGRTLSPAEGEELPREKDACQSGCLIYHSVINRPEHPSIPAEIERQVAQNECRNECGGKYSETRKELAACEFGCEVGCLYFRNTGRGPKVKLTIVVEETINEIPIDKNDLEPVLNDPALRPQIEDTQSPSDVQSKIPSSSFTNLPVNHHEQGCGEEFHLCDTWIEGQSTMCIVAILLLASALFVMFWKTRNDSNASDEAPLLPEKVPLYPSA